MIITDLDTKEIIKIFPSKIYQKQIRRKYMCPCGGSYTIRVKNIHEHTNRHSRWEASLERHILH